MGDTYRTAQLALALSVALLAGACACVRAEAPRLSAEPDRYSLTTDDLVTISVKLESDVTSSAPVLDFDPGPNFELVSRSQTGEYTSGGFGVVNRTGWELGLHPLKTGNLELPVVRVRLRGRVLTAQPGRVVVTSGQPARDLGPKQTEPGAGERPFSGSPEFAIVCEPDRTEVYVGEPVLMTVWYYMRVQLITQDLPGAEPPKAPGFVTVELPRSRRETVAVGGIDYDRFARRWAMTPTQPGTQTVRSSPERLRMDIGGEREYVSSPVRIRVKQRPDPPAGQVFSGIVGRFVAQLAASSTQVKAGEPLTLKLIVDGAGSLATFKPPPLKVPEGTTVTQGELKVTTQPRMSGDQLAIGGRAEVEYAVVPRAPGTLEIPPVELVTFDARAGRYVTLRTESVKVTVTPGEAIHPASPDSGPDLRHIRTAGLRTTAPKAAWACWWFWALALAPLGAVAWAVNHLLRARRAAANPGLRRARLAADNARRALAAVATSSGDPADHVEATLLAFFADRFGLQGSQLTADSILEQLTTRGVGANSAQAMAHLLGRLHQARFAPAVVRKVDAVELAAEALRLVEAVDREAPRP